MEHGWCGRCSTRPTGAAPGARALQRLTALLTRRGLVVLISDLLFDARVGLAALRYLRTRTPGDSSSILWITAEVKLAGPPEVRSRTPSHRRAWSWARELAHAYVETVQREIAAWRTACRRHGSPTTTCRLDLPFGMALRPAHVSFPPPRGVAWARRRGDPRTAPSVAAPEATRSRISHRSATERGGTSERAALQSLRHLLCWSSAPR